MKGIIHIENFVKSPEKELITLLKAVTWDERMKRKTASFGEAYNYSQMSYPYQEFLPSLENMINNIEKEIGFRANNCLINYYQDGKSTMGYHSDQTDVLVENTGIVIISLGASRSIQFRNIEQKETQKDFVLNTGSLFYMTDKLQEKWQHAIPKSDTTEMRLSLTFRKLIT